MDFELLIIAALLREVEEAVENHATSAAMGTLGRMAQNARLYYEAIERAERLLSEQAHEIIRLRGKIDLLEAANHDTRSIDPFAYATSQELPRR